MLGEQRPHLTWPTLLLCSRLDFSQTRLFAKATGKALDLVRNKCLRQSDFVHLVTCEGFEYNYLLGYKNDRNIK